LIQLANDGFARADSREQRRTRDERVADLMEAAVRVRIELPTLPIHSVSSSSELSPEGACGRLLHRIEISVRPIVRIDGEQRGLGQESRTRTLVPLRRMNEERMTQVHRAGVARRGHDGAMSTRRKAIRRELSQRQPLFSCRRELPGDVCV
jgi:hypothetical protein